MTFVVETVADYVNRFSISDTSEFTRAKIAELVTDLVAAAAAGFATDPAKAARAVAANLFQSGGAGVWFSTDRLSSCAAAFCNSAAASALDVDDGHREAIGHPGAAVIPAVLAEGEIMGASESDLLSAIAVGYEVGIRIAAAQTDRIERRDYATGRWSSIAVAASVGHLRRLECDALSQALAIAATHRACQIPSGTSTKLGQIKEGIPWSTLGGYFAVRLAEQGVTASLDIFDIASLFKGALITRSLGNTLKIDATYTKPYCCCRWIHSSIDALLMLMQNHGVGAEAIEAIVVDTIGPAARLNNKTSPTSNFEAQFSVPYCLAVAAIEGAQAMLTPDMGDLTDAARIDLARKVTVRADRDLDASFPAQTGSRVRLISQLGSFEGRVDFPKGDARNPMTLDELEQKFRTLVRYGLEPARAERTIVAAEATGSSKMANILDAIGYRKAV
ncbi:MAG: MmgE/PrpD family protein [Mesorhizobium sp.]|uniref:MmgE/PrpD family protein n=1 Tax=Mesorhizobium sp. TaxID=1871066 RepID=UPI00122292C8|nr:MmgE/PrpD family protein [Mesorhizobium sp.]TIT04429.1 MAG: MmgE/PrpD family protein [Mesorhizobium sp.]TKD38705.1 MAG: MmgE/PrpD family protein [Mesorhizobium sp.]